jgi:O-antigen/teichoic acid export membrane protein
VRYGTRLFLLASLIITICFLGGVRFLDDQEKWRGIRDYGLLVAGWFSVSALCQALAADLQGFDEFRASALVGARNGGIIANCLFLSGVALAIFTGTLSLHFGLGLQLATNTLAAVWAWKKLDGVVSRRRLDSPRDDQMPSPAFFSFRWFFAQCWPLLIIQLTSLGIQQVDVLMVGWLCEEKSIATYGVIARIGEILAAAQLLSTTIAAPFISELYAKGQLPKLEKMLRGIASFVAIPTLATSVLFLAAPALALKWVFGPSFVDGAMTLQIVTLGSTVATLTGLNALTMMMVGQHRQLLWMSICANVVYLGLAPVLIRYWGIQGAAAATAIVFGVYNMAVTLRIRTTLGIWTVPSFTPQAYAFALRQVFQRRG